MKRFISLLLLLGLAGGSRADVPGTISVQGRLTDVMGAPLNGVYQINFTVYGSSTGTDSLWSSGDRAVTVSNGLFSYRLGDDVSLPSDLFAGSERYLGITVGSDPEISPRTVLTSTPYAVYARRADTAAYALAGEFSGDYVAAGGDTMTGALSFERIGTGGPEARLVPGGVPIDQYANLEFLDTDSMTVKLWGQDFGELNLHHGSTGKKLVELAAPVGGGELRLSDSLKDVIGLFAGQTGDDAVVFPDGAINSLEILNEPGFAYSGSSDVIYLDTLAMQDIETATITIPAPGYVVLLARCNAIFANGRNVRTAWVQIDETAGGYRILGEYSTAKVDSTLSLNEHAMPLFTSRVYYKGAAGTYSFRLEGMAFNKGSGANVCAYNSRMLALYMPTSLGEAYGTVRYPDGHPDAVLTQSSSRLEDVGGEAQHEVDLRYYEIRVLEAERRALEARLELQAARQRTARGE